MGWQEFLMEHGIGSPGYIAKTMAKQYRAIKDANPSLDERSVLFRLYANRVAAQSVLGGPAEYQEARKDSSLIQTIVDNFQDLFSIIKHSVLIEHPELRNRSAPANRFEILNRVLARVLDREAPGWRKPQWQHHLPEDPQQTAVRVEKRSNMQFSVAYAMSDMRIQEGIPIEAALSLFLRDCKEPGIQTLDRLQSLRALLSEPITAEQAEALGDALPKPATLEDVIEWLSNSTLPWPVFQERRREFEAKLKKINTDQQKPE